MVKGSKRLAGDKCMAPCEAIDPANFMVEEDYNLSQIEFGHVNVTEIATGE